MYVSDNLEILVLSSKADKSNKFNTTKLYQGMRIVQILHSNTLTVTII